MSRIGKQPVSVPSGVTVTVGNDNVLVVKGPKGELKQQIDRDIKVEVKDGAVTFSASYRPDPSSCIAWFVPCVDSQPG